MRVESGHNDHISRASGTLGLLLCHALFIILLGAALLKLTDLGAFHSAVRTWRLLPDWLLSPITILVPVAELAVALAWVLGLHRRPAIWAFAALLSGFSVAYGMHVILAEPPDCGCFGFQLRFERWRDQVTASIGRNLIMLAALGVGATLAWPRLSRRVCEAGCSGGGEAT